MSHTSLSVERLLKNKIVEQPPDQAIRQVCTAADRSLADKGEERPQKHRLPQYLPH
jgi:hypothetical protein